MELKIQEESPGVIEQLCIQSNHFIMSLQAITNDLKKLIREMRDKNVPLPFLFCNERRAVSFLAEDIIVLEEHMNKTYQRRKQLLNNHS